MDLKEFVAETMRSVAEAMAETGGSAGPGEVAFDLAVQARPADAPGGRPTIEVVGDAGAAAPPPSRVRFSVPLATAPARHAAREERPTDLEWE